jgi:hypothetical protein
MGLAVLSFAPGFSGTGGIVGIVATVAIIAALGFLAPIVLSFRVALVVSTLGLGARAAPIGVGIVPSLTVACMVPGISGMAVIATIASTIAVSVAAIVVAPVLVAPVGPFAVAIAPVARATLSIAAPVVAPTWIRLRATAVSVVVVPAVVTGVSGVGIVPIAPGVVAACRPTITAIASMIVIPSGTPNGGAAGRP